MVLLIEDPRAQQLAERIARLRHISVTEAVVQTLEAQDRILAEHPLEKRLDAIADSLAALTQPGGRDVTQGDIDTLWGHSDRPG